MLHHHWGRDEDPLVPTERRRTLAGDYRVENSLGRALQGIPEKSGKKSSGDGSMMRGSHLIGGRGVCSAQNIVILPALPGV